MKVSTVSLADVGLESATLGSTLLSRANAEALIRDGSPDLFTIPFTRDIFEAICGLGAGALDCSLLKHELDRRGKDIAWDAILNLDLGVVPAIPMSERLTRLRELHRLRQLGKLGERLASAPFGVGAKSQDLIAEVRSELEEIARV